MIRRRFQNGCLTVKGKGQKMWVARWRETMLQAGQYFEQGASLKGARPCQQDLQK